MITQAERDDALECYYDYYKSVHGIRPRWVSFDGMSRDEIDAEFQSLKLTADVVFAAEAEREQKAIERFEQLVSDTINSGAQNRETALRWIMDGSEAMGDWEYFCYLNGLPYGYFRKVA